MRRPPPSANFTDTRSQASTSWTPDTGSSHHVAPDLSGFDTAEPYCGEDNLYVGNGKGLPIFHVGSSKIYSPNKSLSLSQILHVPDIKRHLLSVQKFCLDNNVYFEFHATFFVIKDTTTHRILLTGPSNGGLYSIRLPPRPPEVSSTPKVAFSAVRASAQTWHQRLGHPHSQLFRSMLSSFQLPLSNKCTDFSCDSCFIGKSSKLHLLSSSYKSCSILDLVVCDVWGPAPVPSSDGHLYFLLCVDHFSSYMWLFPLKQKSDVFHTFKLFVAMAERQFQTKLKSVQTDWGGEFRNLSTFFSPLGILHRLSCPHTSEQNGVVERRHRHVVETGLTLLAQSHVPKRFWHFAFTTAAYLINRMPTRNKNYSSPFEHLFHRKPNLTFLRVFGCRCYPHLRSYNRHKMDLRSTPCVFLGYSPSHHGYRCLDPISDKIYIARHVRFDESSFPFNTPSPTPPTPIPDPYVSSYPDPTPSPATQPTPSSSTPTPTPPNNPPIQTYHRRPKQPTSNTVPTETAPQPHPSSTLIPSPTPTRTRPPNLRPHPKPTKLFDPSSFHTSTNYSETEPPNFTIANSHPQWRTTMSDEYSALMRNDTWSLVPRVPGIIVVDCKWVYKLPSPDTKRDLSLRVSGNNRESIIRKPLARLSKPPLSE